VWEKGGKNVLKKVDLAWHTEKRAGVAPEGNELVREIKEHKRVQLRRRYAQ